MERDGASSSWKGSLIMLSEAVGTANVFNLHWEPPQISEHDARKGRNGVSHMLAVLPTALGRSHAVGATEGGH